MLWKKLLAPALLAVTLATGALSAASAAVAPVVTDAFAMQTALPAQDATATPTTTPSPTSTPPVTDPAVVCATPTLHPALPALCALWQGNTLPEQAQADLGKLIVRLARSAQERRHISDPAVACETPGLHPALPALCALWLGGTLPEDAREVIGRVILRLANGKAEREPRRDGGEDGKLVEVCWKYLAEHPDLDNPRAQFCERVVAGEVTSARGPKDFEQRGQRDERKAKPESRGRHGVPNVTPTPTATPNG